MAIISANDDCWSPYVIAEKQGINLDYCYLGNEIVAIYADLNGYQIVLNPRVDHDRQEDALQLLIEHHNSRLRGTERCVLKKELERFFKIRAELSLLPKILVNSLIMRKINHEKR